MNVMRDITLEKVVINIGTGNDTNAQSNAKKLLTSLTGKKSTNTISKRRIPAFKITKGTHIGAFITIRGKPAKSLSERLFKTIDNQINNKAISGNTVNFGIKEYIDIPDLKYDPVIGVIGMNVNITFKRKGIRVQTRKRAHSKVGKRHMLINREDMVNYLKENAGVEVMSTEGAEQ